MAAAAPSGGIGGSGGGSLGGTGSVSDGSIGSGDGILGGQSLSGEEIDGFLEARAARTFAQAVVRSPAQSSHRLTCSLGGCDLDDEVWEVRFNFFGRDNLERTLGKSDITYLNLLALIEQEGYGLLDSMYFVKEKGTGMAGVLAATGRDGNNNIFPIAFGLVEKEDTASWGWFLTQLKIAIGGEEGKFGRYTIISDRQKGLLNAINQIFPNCPQRYCLRHIYSNFQIAGYKGEELKKFMDAGAYSYTKHGFDVAMEQMKEESEEAYLWLMKIPVETWAKYVMD